MEKNLSAPERWKKGSGLPFPFLFDAHPHTNPTQAELGGNFASTKASFEDQPPEKGG